MSGEARKLHLIEEILRTENEALLSEVESVLNKGRTSQPYARKSFKEFSGLLTESEADEMQRIIQEGCEQINPDDWK